MQRIHAEPRPRWREELVKAGVVTDSRSLQYAWAEDVFYVLTRAEARDISALACQVFQLALSTVHSAVAHDRLEEFLIPDELIPAVIRSWHEKIPPLLTRIDFVPSGSNGLEVAAIEAENPAGLRLVGPVQWDWKNQSFRIGTQYNELYELLLYSFKHSRLSKMRWLFAAEDGEERAAARYLYYIAKEAQLDCHYNRLSRLSWDEAEERILMENGELAGAACIMQSWRTFCRSTLGSQSANKVLYAFEPAWKALMSAPSFLAEFALHYGRNFPCSTTHEHGTVVQCWMVNNRDAAVTVCEMRDGMKTIVPHVLFN